MGGKVPGLRRVEHHGGISQNGCFRKIRRFRVFFFSFYAADAPRLAISEIDTEDEHRYHTGLSELDRVLGGGLVKGSLVLISGDPGIGKSTILLQICEYLGQKLRILYVSGEESARQIKLRAGRLGVSSPNLAHFGGNGRAACGGAHSHRKTGYRDDRLHPNDELY